MFLPDIFIGQYFAWKNNDIENKISFFKTKFHVCVLNITTKI